MKTALKTAVLALALAAWAPAFAGLVSARLPVVVYDGPSENSTPRFLLGEGYPLVVIAETSNWLTVCMHDGASGYVHRRDTKPGDNVVVVQPTAIRADPSASAQVLLNAGGGLLLANTGDVITGWLPVRHESGAAGFAAALDVWGHTGC